MKPDASGSGAEREDGPTLFGNGAERPVGGDRSPRLAGRVLTQRRLTHLRNTAGGTRAVNMTSF